MTATQLAPNLFSSRSLSVEGNGFKVDVRNVVPHEAEAQDFGVASAGEDVAGRDAKFEEPHLAGARSEGLSCRALTSVLYLPRVVGLGSQLERGYVDRPAKVRPTQQLHPLQLGLSPASCPSNYGMETMLMIQAHGALYALILIMRTSSLIGLSGGKEKGTKPAQARRRKGCYAVFISGGERVTIFNIVQKNTIASSVPFCFRLSIASGDGQGQDSPHSKHSASS